MHQPRQRLQIVRDGHAQLAGQTDVGLQDQRALLRRHPPHQLVIRAVPPGVLGGQDRLADPARAGQRLRQRHRLLTGQPLPQLG